MEYKINFKSDSFYYDYVTDEIQIGLKTTDYLLSENKLIEYINDSITHEHMHRVIDKYVGSFEGRMFDVIEHKFGNYLLKKKVFNMLGHIITWKDSIKRDGFESFLSHYCINTEYHNYLGKLQKDQIPATTI